MTSGAVDRSMFDGMLRESPDWPGRFEACLAVPTAQAHAAMLEGLPGGDLGCTWFGGTQEGSADVSIWFARLAPESHRWSDPVRVSEDSALSEQNPVLFATPTGELWLLFTAQPAGNQDLADVRRRISRDGGSTWGPTETLFTRSSAGGAFIRQPLVITRTGRWLLPIFRCARSNDSTWVGDHDSSAVMISDDLGRSWREVVVPQSLGLVHMSVASLAEGSLYALFRSRRADRIHESRSIDDGLSWSSPEPTELPNNNSSINLTALSDGRLVVIYNHSSRLDVLDSVESGAFFRADDDHRRVAFWGAPRAPMSLAFSLDHGRHWSPPWSVEEGDGYCLSNNSRDGLNRELSYPAVRPRDDGGLDLVYTYFRQTIKHVRLSAEATSSWLSRP